LPLSIYFHSSDDLIQRFQRRQRNDALRGDASRKELRMKRLSFRSSAGKCLADLLVVVVLIPFLMAVFVGCYQRSYGHDGRISCAAHLKAIGNALLMYSNDNKGQYPRTRYAPGPKIIPTAGTGAATTQPFSEDGPAPNDVTAAIYLLLATQDITGDSFVCPSSSADKWDFGGGNNTASNWSNWNGIDEFRKYVSYSYQNPYPDDAAVASGFKLDVNAGADFAVFADINPGNGALAVLPNSKSELMVKANSRNHDGAGQNVLYGDGHVDWVQTPFCGVANDNIYTRSKGTKDLASEDVWNSPRDLHDNVLLPTSE
jgi:prepilin-type processing-associated H-X9-DG protein